MDLKKIGDIFFFRESDPGDDYSSEPVYTTGSIVLGMLLRTFIVVILTYLVVIKFELREHWFVSLFVVWFFAIYPGYKQYANFQKRMESFREETLCGTCRYFNSDAQMCRIYDEHVSKDHLPCEGQSWEPK